jgi:CDGSH-type Zn-finger protein
MRSAVTVCRSSFGTTAIICNGNREKSDPTTASPVTTTGATSSSSSSGEKKDQQLEEVSEVILKEIPDSKVHWEYQQSNETAKVYDRKPIKIKCKEGRIYMWCACGWSRNQPFCDGTHRISQFQIKLMPIPWTCKKTGYYWFCNCKKTGKKVFCDGTHVNLIDDPNVIPTIKH